MASALKLSAIAAGAAVLLATVAMPADAKCTRLAFSVNDYGKDGPAKDAKDLLDKYIAKRMGEQGVKTYKTGKKDVTCELFLDFGFFDEYTCKAVADVCWSEGGTTNASTPAAAVGATGSVPKAAAPAAKPATN
jgi:hypothetical protein